MRNHTITGLILLPILISCSISTHAQNQQNVSELDWVSKENLTKEQSKNCHEACRGAYIAPIRTDDDATRKPNESPIRGEADSSEINIESAAARMEGDVVFTQGWRQLQSEVVEIDRTKGSLTLEGNVSIREPGILLVGESAYIDSSSDQVDIRQAEYLFHEQRIRGSASSISRSPTNGISIDDASYTACEPGDEAWVLYADNIKINEETGRASAKGVRIETSGVPIFYAPYFQFIVDDRRASGLLYPSIGYSDDEGIQYSQPIYVNVSPNQDLTLTPKITSKRSSGLEAEHRLLTKNSYTRSAGAFYPDDDINPEHSDERWTASITHKSKQSDVWGKLITQVDFSAISDDDFLEDWDTEVVEAGQRDVYLRQHAGVTVELDHWRLHASATDYQNLIDDNLDQYRELPRISVDGNYQLAGDQNSKLSVELLNEWTSFDLESKEVLVATGSLFTSSFLPSQITRDGTLATGDRLASNWSIGWNKQSTWGFFKPKIGINYLAYDLEKPLLGSNESDPDAFASEASIDAGLTFEREASWFGKSTYQTLQPRIYYLYRDSDSQTNLPVFDTTTATESLDQLFRDSNFVGGDRLEDASRLSLGLWSRFYSNDSDREVLSLGIGQSYYLKDRTTFLNLSDAFIGIPLLESVLVSPPNIPTSEFITFANSPLSSTAGALLADLQKRRNEQQRDRSDVISEAIWNVSKSLAVKGSVFWNDQSSEMTRSNVELSYRFAKTDDFLKLAYTQEDNHLSIRDSNQNSIIEANELIDEDVEQLSISGQLSVNERWKLLFLWREDLENNRNLDRVAGISYQSCCWNISLSWRDELRRLDNDGLITEAPRSDSSIVINFEFVGLGGLGTSARSLIEDR